MATGERMPFESEEFVSLGRGGPRTVLGLGYRSGVTGIVECLLPGQGIGESPTAVWADSAAKGATRNAPQSGPILVVARPTPPNFALAGGRPWGLQGSATKGLPPELFPGPYPSLPNRKPGDPDLRDGLQNWAGNHKRLKEAIAKPITSEQPSEPNPRKAALESWIQEKLVRAELVVEVAAEEGKANQGQTTAERIQKSRWRNSDAGKAFADECARAVYNASRRGGTAEAGAGKAEVAGIEIMWALHDFSLCNLSIERMSRFAAGLIKMYPDAD